MTDIYRPLSLPSSPVADVPAINTSNYTYTGLPNVQEYLNSANMVSPSAPKNIWEGFNTYGQGTQSGGMGLKVNPDWMGQTTKESGLFDGFRLFDSPEGKGQLGNILGVAQGAGNLFMGMKQYGFAKDSLNQAKEQYNRNYAAQKTTTNATLQDRQRARVASNPGAYVSVDEYMAQNGIK